MSYRFTTTRRVAAVNWPRWKREADRLYRRGLSDDEIAAELGITAKTLRTYTDRLGLKVETYVRKRRLVPKETSNDATS